MNNSCDTTFDYSAYDANYAVTFLMPEFKNIICMSYQIPWQRWEEVVRSHRCGLCVIAECCWLTCPVKREDWYKENLRGLT
ncbi:MAG: hypothetical protein HWQ36_26290 [Nostoc sp. NMS2]|uniref:hypothetical protein n=1 Tax=Nostoc sp. NMS2 TaxID=2815389 RepID=UPI0025FBAD8E|nr:hypothetical protein [Nostoc sp. NMS2]MBN3993898.1 hypothetical protein [Nostoc sp. NMS2]